LKPPPDAAMKFHQLVDVFNHFVILATYNFKTFPKSWMLKAGMPQDLRASMMAVIRGTPKGVPTLLNGPKNEKKVLKRKFRNTQ
jgi:hypothetical protein